LKRTGLTNLWLVEGGVPHFPEMVVLGREIVRALVDQLGPENCVKRFADPYWLSSLACVLGFEWDTSGQTTVTLRALKAGLRGTEIPVRILGGKGEEMRAVQFEAASIVREIGVESVGEIRRVSRTTCAIDEAALQDSYSIYFHATIVSEKGSWAVVNQGKNPTDRTARRYHWSSDTGLTVEEPHAEIVGERVEEIVLDMTSRRSLEARRTVVEMLSDTPPSRLNDDLQQAKALLKKQSLLDRELPVQLENLPPHLLPPQKLDTETLRRAKNVTGFEELLNTQGVGPATIRGLAYIACLVYGARASWNDPVKYAYAFGTKSGKPYYVDKKAMREAADFLRTAVMRARLGEGEKIMALRRLASLLESENN
jgi:hypothetical protein